MNAARGNRPTVELATQDSPLQTGLPRKDAPPPETPTSPSSAEKVSAIKETDTRDPMKRSLAYDFVSELSPGIWKVIRKKDRFEFLAAESTASFRENGLSWTVLAQLLHPVTGLGDVGGAISRVLNHENLVNCVDWIEVKVCPNMKVALCWSRIYIVWDFCNAGTLENLFMPARTILTIEDEELAMKEKEEAKQNAEYDAMQIDSGGSKPFLPESFCWHVMCSILKALAWLHHGVREEYNVQTKRYETIRADVDWQTILHRAITPDNIFFCHPQTRFETYGLCKLGNFSDAFVSGHLNGILGDKVLSATGKVLAPQVGNRMTLDELRQADEFLPNNYPPEGGQPYTILTEYRSLADVIMSMMVWPMYAGMDHLKHIRGLGRTDWRRQLDGSAYSGELKNFVYELMSKDEVEDLSSQNLYQRAKQGFLRFRNIIPEGKEIITVDTVRSQRAMVLQQEALEQRRETARLNAWFKKQEARAQARAQSPDRASVGEQTQLLADIFNLCEAVRKS